MNFGSDFDTKKYGQASGQPHIDPQLHPDDFAFLEARPSKRPFLAKIRHGLHTLTQISKIHIHVTFEMRESLAE